MLKLSPSALLVLGLLLLVTSLVVRRFALAPSFVDGFLIGLSIVLLIGGLVRSGSLLRS